MSSVTNDTKYLTLMRLKAMYPDLFYDQNWYDTEEFAHRPLERGDHRMFVDYKPQIPTAVACAYYYITKATQRPADKILPWANQYVWTKDYDHNGDRVYVGGWMEGTKPGFQIHRHLKLRNVIEVGYSLDLKRS